MPRIYNNEGEPLDYCNGCYEEAEEDAQADGLDCDADHPPYEEEHSPYHCESCGEELTQEDN
jgi:hypothetical protein